jgi:glycosyltransferase involved in cell wall biosynthesis
LLPAGEVEFEVRPLFPEGAYENLYKRGHLTAKAIYTLIGAARRIADVRRAERWDVVLLFREAFPLGPPLIETLLEKRVPVVYDFDDAIFIGDTSPANQIVKHWKQPSKVGRIVEAATMTTVGNAWLANYAHRYSPNVTLLPTTIDIAEYAFRPRPVSDRLTVGWSGSRTTSAHLRTIDGGLRRMLSELPVDLVVIGDPDYRLPRAPNVTVLPWRASTELQDLDRIDVGLMPLPDNDWSRGKCGLKALQYMAVGAVAVVSPVGVNPDIIEHDGNGLIADSDDEWVEAVGSLVDDHRCRQRLAAAGRTTVEDEYSGQAWAPRFLEVLENAAATHA